jgi:hypothetical protein
MYFFSEYSDNEKIDIARQLKEHTEETADKDFKKLTTAVSKDLSAIKPLSPLGLNFIEYFVHTELLNTKSKYGISFYDFWYNRDFYMSRDASTLKLIASIKKNKPYLTDTKIGKQVFNLYYGGISIFRPTTAAKLYNQIQPRPQCILDFTMGWGGRLVGAAILNVPKYIGIDSNNNLEEPYKKMVEYLSSKTETIFDLKFQDALTVDYSTLDYDMVFTSPPYYNKEVYGSKNAPYKTNAEWDEKFYKPLFETTWDNLKSGGHYCLNIPQCIYEKICVPLFGEAMELIELKKYSRILPKGETKQFNVGQKYKEFIYIWKK